MSKSLKDKRLGETRMQNCGMTATIIDYTNTNDITVEFSDNTVLSNKRYYAFVNGSIEHPDKNRYTRITKSDRTGETRMMNCGLEATIIAYENARNITVKFPDGTELKNKCYTEFKKGEILHPNTKKRYKTTNREKSERIGNTHTQNCGIEATIIAYENSSNITVRFPDGTEVTNKSYAEFKNGTIIHPNMDKYEQIRDIHRKKHIGETRMMKCGLEATITEYITSYDITVKFSDNTEVKHKSYSSFKKGGIGHPTIKTPKNTKANLHLGEIRTMNCGLEAEIIAYESYKNITVRFSDGTEVPNRQYCCFERGQIKYPSKKKKKTNNLSTIKHRESTEAQREKRIGETRTMNCGLEATIIEYINSENITVEFSDKTKLTNRTYDQFIKGKIRHPNPLFHTRKKQIIKTHVQNCGLNATLIKYKTLANCDFMFEDGTIVENKNHHNFIMSTIKHPTLSGRFKSSIGKIHYRSESKIYHTRIFGIAHHNLNGNACYYAHCPICGTHAIWPFKTIKNHECNQELVEKREALIQELTKTHNNDTDVA